MSHEPECPCHGPNYDPAPPCICNILRAAYQRGLADVDADAVRQNAAYQRGYADGRNAQAASRAHAEAIYGPYKKPVPGNPSVVINSSPHFIQHGKGENP